MAHNRLRAFDIVTGEPVKVGDSVTSFRGQPGLLMALIRPNGPGHEGKVTVRTAIDMLPGTYYAGVWGLRVEHTPADAPITVEGD